RSSDCESAIEQRRLAHADTGHRGRNLVTDPAVLWVVRRRQPGADDSVTQCHRDALRVHTRTTVRRYDTEGGCCRGDSPGRSWLRKHWTGGVNHEAGIEHAAVPRPVNEHHLDGMRAIGEVARMCVHAACAATTCPVVER